MPDIMMEPVSANKAPDQEKRALEKCGLCGTALKGSQRASSRCAAHRARLAPPVLAHPFSDAAALGSSAVQKDGFRSQAPLLARSAQFCETGISPLSLKTTKNKQALIYFRGGAGSPLQRRLRTNTPGPGPRPQSAPSLRCFRQPATLYPGWSLYTWQIRKALCKSGRGSQRICPSAEADLAPRDAAQSAGGLPLQRFMHLSRRCCHSDYVVSCINRTADPY